mgnify:CR=1 FL=1
MKANEQIVIKQYLQHAYNKMMKARKDNQYLKSDRFPMVSKELAVAEYGFDLLSRIARDLGISNPWEAIEWEILVVED